MRDAVFFEGPETGRRLSRFWILITLAAIIAAAGVVADSTATVIGAMIVAPLMVPIQGSMLAVVLGDRTNLVRSVGLVAAGALAAVAIGFAVGLLVVHDVDAGNNAQVAARVSPRLIDLLAALATGAVGSVALARRDISDTLPGVAIAISLVPPLSVIGLTLEAGQAGQAGGALLLFLTNVAAILATGTIVMAIYGAHRTEGAEPGRIPDINRRNAVVTIALLVALVSVPLTISSIQIAATTTEEIEVSDAAQTWADANGWELTEVVQEEGKTVARLEGPLPVPDLASLRSELRDEGVDLDHVRLDLLPRETVDLGEG
jgi:uncharacterized hydrophobic protein (TIGR00271 family)